MKFVLESDLLKLFPIEASDFELLYDLAKDPLIWEQHPQNDRYKREVFEKFFEGALASDTAYKIWHKKDERYIGTTRFYDWDEIERSCAIGYTFLIRAYWGGVTNGDLKKLMLDEVFQYVDKVIFHVGPQNIRSQKAVMKLGAAYQGMVPFVRAGQNVEVVNQWYLLEKEVWQKKSSVQ